MGSVLFLILLIYILIQVPGVQNFARGKVVSYLENKIHTKVQIRRLALDFPKKLVLEGVYFEDQQKDTLFSGGKIRVDIALLKLVSSEVVINYVELQDLRANIYRKGSDTVFNYQYIIDAFVTPPDTTKVKDTTGGMKFNVDRILLDNIGGSFRDDQTGIDFLVHLGKFETAFRKFDLDKMIFSLPNIRLENVSGHMYQNKPLLEQESTATVEAESNEPFQLQLGLENIDIRKIKFDYRNDVSVMAANLDLGELAGKVKSIDLANLDIKLDNLKLHNTSAGIFLGKSEQTKIVKEEINKEVVAQANNLWKFSLANLDFQNINLVFNDDNKPTLSSGMDYAHMKFDSFILKGKDLVFTPSTYQGDITAGSFQEKSGFNLKQLQTQFLYSDTGAALNNLYIETDRTLLRDNIVVRYPSLEAVTKDLGKLYIDANFSKTNIAAKDILVFAPQLRTNLKGNENAIVHINARVMGYLSDLHIPGFEVSGIGNTVLSMSGNIKGLPDATKAVYDFDIKNFQTTRSDLVNLLPPGTIPPTVRIPETMKVSGSFKGLATNFTTDLVLQTNKGTATLAGTLNSVNETYNLKGSLNNVDVGYLAKQDTMVGKVSMNFTARGRGFKPASMNTNASAFVKNAFVKGYNYQNLDVTASVRKGYTTIDAGMADKSLSFRLNGAALIDDKFATNIKMRLLLDSILLKPLGFAATDLRIHGNILADFATTDLNAPQGELQIGELVVANEGQVYQADTIRLTAATTDTGKVITLQSQIATAAISGDYNLATLGQGAMQVIDKYYDLGIKDSAMIPNKWKLTATVIPDSLLFVFVPSLAGSDTMKLNANFDGAARQMELVVNAPKVQMGTQALDSLTITAGTEGEQLVYAATMEKAGSKTFQLQRTTINGFLANNELFTHLNIKDLDGKDKYELGAKVSQEADGGIRANLSDTLMLDYDKWNVDNSNYIKYDSSGIIVHNFTISNKGQALSVKSESENVTAPIAVNLRDFHIKTLTNLAERDSLRIDGVINGNVLVKNAMSTPVFTSDIRIDTLRFNGDTVGNIAVKVDNETANAFNADLAISGNGNDVRLAGKYFTGEGRMDMKLNINKFLLTSLKPFTFGALREADGDLRGAIDIKGTAADPDVNGNIRFDKAHITPAATGERLSLANEVITVSSRDISFNRFTMVDSAGNKAILNGKVFTTDFKTYSFDLDLDAKNFRVLSAPPRQNALYYGDLNMDANVKVDGSVSAPVVNAAFRINKATNITFVLPSANPEIEDREGVVEFVDVYGAKPDSIFKSLVDSLTKVPELAGMDVSVTLESDTSAQITLVIDERSGDALKIRGAANLSGGIDKSGKISLTGNYELQAGSYQLSLSLLKRQFLIQPGSVITWTGDMMSADVNITAEYIANTQPANLLQNELAGMSQTDLGKYKSKVPFSVLLKMNGELLKPVITFDIELPENERSKWTDVEAKLEQIRKDDAELNKQVFALLLLGRFVQENPMENAVEGGGLATTAKSSVSKLLAEQLNNLAGSLIKGVDLNFGLTTEDDYTSGNRETRTDLTVGVSKSVLNDRLRVSVGSNFELDGPTQAGEKQANNLIGDVAVDYLLSKDGRYALRAYSRNRYEAEVEGQIIESGVSFVFTLNFNEFKQILNKKTAQQKAEAKLRDERNKQIDEAEKAQREAEEKAAAEKKPGEIQK